MGRGAHGVVVVLAVGLAITACRRKLPEDFPMAYVDAVSDMADEAVKHCDRLLRDKNCYSALTTPGGRRSDPGRGVPLPANPIGGTVELRQLEARCDSSQEHDWQNVEYAGRWCDAQRVMRSPLPSECAVFSTFGNWPVDSSFEKEVTSVGIPENPECKQPWVDVVAIRKSPGGDWMQMYARFLNRKWLAEHPEPDASPPAESPTVEPCPPCGGETR